MFPEQHTLSNENKEKVHIANPLFSHVAVPLFKRKSHAATCLHESNKFLTQFCMDDDPFYS